MMQINQFYLLVGLVIPLNKFLDGITKNPPVRVQGTAIYMFGHPQYTPTTLVQNLHHFNCLHEHLILLFVQTLDIPYVPSSNRVRLQNIGPKMYRVVVQYGFMDMPNVPVELKGLTLDDGDELKPFEATYFLGREHIMASSKKGMAIWREHIFSVMSRNAQPATHFFQLPKNRVMEIGSLIEI
jgi:KUP system potassium uptake protein